MNETEREITIKLAEEMLKKCSLTFPSGASLLEKIQALVNDRQKKDEQLMRLIDSMTEGEVVLKDSDGTARHFKKTDNTETTSTGAVRNHLFPKPGNFIFPVYDYRLDLVYNNDVVIRRMAYTYGEGAGKYGDKNWMKGFEETVLLAHGFEHLRLHISGDRTEDHLAHAVWNFSTLMWVQEKKPELMNLTGEYDKLKAASNAKTPVR